MDEREFKRRTMRFALDVMALVEELPRTTVGRAIGGQLVRCGTSVGANYRAACRAKSTADMVSKLGTVEEEADECVYWFELIVLGNLLPAERVEPLAREANEIVSMVVASIRTLRDHR
jgi:four helix bundle protein